MKYHLRILRYLITGRQLPARCRACGRYCFGGWIDTAAPGGKILHWCLRPECTAANNVERPS